MARREPDEEELERRTFTPEVLDKTVIALPLLEVLKAEEEAKARLEALRKKGRKSAADRAEIEALEKTAGVLHPVIIDLNLFYPGGRQAARERVEKEVTAIIAERISETGHIAEIPLNFVGSQGIDAAKSRYSQQYLFARLEGAVIRRLVARDNRAEPTSTDETPGASIAHRAIYRIWPDFPVRSLLTKSVTTVKADAARMAFAAQGKDILWAVVDSGIDKSHPHFQRHKNLEMLQPTDHQDFSGSGDPLHDGFGHGTHVAGIIAGELGAAGAPCKEIVAYSRHRDEHGEVTYDTVEIETISGIAPQCKLLSLKVLDDAGNGLASNLIAAIEYIQEMNGYGRRLRIQGVNMSVGYDFEPEWFACGQSPLCVEVDRLVRSGVVVVVAAGNTGYGWAKSAFRGTVAAGMDLTINDPGNAELAITVGSTHRDMPHIYGVSYFSSKGPTGDGRPKPDLVAPGEKILSCAAGERKDKINKTMQSLNKPECTYLEESGTSMAAPHVSGVIAAFLSIRPEFIGQPERVKEIFLSTATDLKRERSFQGFGLVDLMRAIQSV